jgi:hypothetical protein
MRKISPRQSKLAIRGNPDLPPEIGQFISGRSVRLTEPKRYLAKLWRLHLPSLVREVRETEPNVF